MSRADEFSSSAKSPVAKYLQWDSAERTFKHYNKETSKDEYIKMPMNFVVLKEMATISGYHEPTKSGIYSNELATINLKTQELTVKTSKGLLIAKGIYGDIKPTLATAGAKFAMSVYALLNGELVCLKLSGSSFSAWYDFVEKNRKQFISNSVEILSVEDKKKGATKYTQPVFTLGKAIADDVNAKAETAYAELVSYMKSRDNKVDAPELVHAEEVAQPKFEEAPDTSDLPF
jgi:hypothetical protein